MNITEAGHLARNLMNEHGLHTWRFEFDNAKRRFGACRYRTRTISLSKPLTEANDYVEVVDTILHEIAHALTPRAGHGAEWKKMCIKIGAKPERCYSSEEVVSVAGKYRAVCGGCGKVYHRHKRIPRGRRVACLCQKDVRDWNQKQLLDYRVVA